MNRNEYPKLPEFAECLIATRKFFGRIAIGVHYALNRVIASRTGKNL